MTIKRTAERLILMDKVSGNYNCDSKFDIKLVVTIDDILTSDLETGASSVVISAIFSATKSADAGDLWLGVSKDYIPEKVGDGYVGVHLYDASKIAGYNLRTETSGFAEWVEKARPYAEWCLSQLPYVRYIPPDYILDRLEEACLNEPEICDSVYNYPAPSGMKIIGYSYIKAVADNDPADAGLGAQWSWDLIDRSSFWHNHLLIIKATICYVKNQWPFEEYYLSTYVTVHLITDDNGKGDAYLSDYYASYRGYNTIVSGWSYGRAQRGVSQDSTWNLNSVYEGLTCGYMQYDNTLAYASLYYYDGILNGTDTVDYYLSGSIIQHVKDIDTYQLVVELYSPPGTNFNLQVEYRGLIYRSATKNQFDRVRIYFPQDADVEAVRIKVTRGDTVTFVNQQEVSTQSRGIYILSVYVRESADGNYQPYASLKASATSITAGQTVYFDPSGSKDYDGKIIKYRVDFGDGGYVEKTGTPTTVSHTYTYFGVYRVRLKVWDDDSWPFEDNYDVVGLTIRVYEDVSPPGGSPAPGCPFVSTWNGTDYEDENNILVGSERAKRSTLNTDDAYLLERSTTDIRIREFENEVSFIDSVSLYGVYTDGDIAVSPDGEVFAYDDLVAPTSATDMWGVNVSDLLDDIDGPEFPTLDYWYGLPSDYLELKFNATGSRNILIMTVADLYYPATEADINIITPIIKSSFEVQVWNGTEWEYINTVMTRRNWTRVAVDLGEHTGDIKVRLVMLTGNAVSFVGIEHDYVSVKIRKIPLIHAVSNNTNVKCLLKREDHRYVKLRPEENITLNFAPIRAKAYLIHVTGFYFREDSLNESHIGAFSESVPDITTTVMRTEYAPGDDIVFVPLLEDYNGLKGVVWDYGDGTCEIAEIGHHTYNKTGTYTVRAYVIYGCHHIRVYELSIRIIDPFSS